MPERLLSGTNGMRRCVVSANAVVVAEEIGFSMLPSALAPPASFGRCAALVVRQWNWDAGDAGVMTTEKSMPPLTSTGSRETFVRPRAAAAMSNGGSIASARISCACSRRVPVCTQPCATAAYSATF